MYPLNKVIRSLNNQADSLVVQLYLHFLQGMAGSPKQGILTGIILSVSKKLSQQQTELFTLASSLGADYRWLYDESCTHLIHQVRN